MNILKELYKTAVEFIVDLRSTRNQLIWIATSLFIYSVIKGVDSATLGVVAGLLTITYLFYFTSKHNQSKNEHQVLMTQNQFAEDDKNVDNSDSSDTK